jgi:hypothetical protein
VLGVTMPPAGARFHGSLPKLGAPIHTAEYADGFKICAYLEPADPAVGVPEHRRYMPWQWAADRQEFAQRALPDQPRPLYRPENLEHYPDAPVYVFEREDMADAFNALSGDEQVVGTTCAGGSGAFELGDWGELYTREVILWPTNCVPCQQAMHSLARTLEKAGARVSLIAIPQDKPDEWNFNDVTAAAWSWEQVQRFVREQRRKVEAQLLAALPTTVKANGATQLPGPTEKRVRQPAPQTVRWTETWNRIPGLTFGNSGPYGHMANAVAVIEYFRGQYADVWYDEFHCKVMTDEQHPRAWNDHDSLALTRVLQAEIGLAGMRPNTTWDAVNLVAKSRIRHEVREWLQTLQWDEQIRLAMLLPKGFGTETTPYNTHVGRCMMVAAVARILRPGCQVDYVPVFEGPGGKGKTSALRILGGKWFDNPSAQMGEKDFLQNMTGKWWLELAELANIRRHELEVIKAIITRTEDTYRVPYGRSPETHKRQCVFMGTIDRGSWNTDEAGGRRWWPVTCGPRIDLDWLERHRDQLFAEAAWRFNEGERWHEVPEREAAAARARRQPRDEWVVNVQGYVDRLTEVTVSDVLTGGLRMEPREWTPASQARVRLILSQLGWTEHPVTRKWRAPDRIPLTLEPPSTPE